VCGRLFRISGAGVTFSGMGEWFDDEIKVGLMFWKSGLSCVMMGAMFSLALDPIVWE